MNASTFERRGQFRPLPVFQQQRYSSGVFTQPYQRRSECYPEGGSSPRILHLATDMGKDKEKPIDVDETLNPRLGGFMSIMHDADSYVPPLCVLPSPVLTVVGAIRVAPVAAAALVAELCGIAVAGNPTAIA